MVNARNRKWINCEFAIEIVDSKSIREKDSGCLVDSDSTFLVNSWNYKVLWLLICKLIVNSRSLKVILLLSVRLIKSLLGMSLRSRD